MQRVYERTHGWPAFVVKLVQHVLDGGGGLANAGAVIRDLKARADWKTFCIVSLARHFVASLSAYIVVPRAPWLQQAKSQAIFYVLP